MRELFKIYSKISKTRNPVNLNFEFFYRLNCIPTFRLECSRFLFELFFYSSLLIIFILHRSSNKYRVYIYLYRRNQAYRQVG